MITFRGQATHTELVDPFLVEILRGYVAVDGKHHTSVAVHISDRTRLEMRDRDDDAQQRLLEAFRISGLVKLKAAAQRGEFSGPLPPGETLHREMISVDEIVLLDVDAKPCGFREGPEQARVCGAVDHKPPVTNQWCLGCRVPRTELLCMHATHVHILQDPPNRCAIRSVPKSQCDRSPNGAAPGAVVDPESCGGINSCWEVRLDDANVSASPALQQSLVDLLDAGENGTCEFKRYANGTSGKKEEKEKKHSRITKTVCGFFNSWSGGVLLIGVNDQGEVTGLDDDFRTTSKTTVDGYELFLRDMLSSRLSAASLTGLQVTFPDHVDGSLCRVDVPPGREAIFVTREGGCEVGKFYVREGNQTKELVGPDLLKYSAARFEG